MCGIVGICSLKGPESIPLNIVQRMIGAIHHRGPDESGIYIDSCAALGHARLSIIDISGGTQPIHNEDETLWIVYNGEVFNYPELREGLLNKGHHFYTSTDTEVILHLFEEKGPSCIDNLNGQFAFALWDTKKRELFLARDRIGIRPLYYAILGDRIIFSSEVKSLFASEIISRRIDPIALDQIFTFWTTLPGRTSFKGVNELPPGHYLSASEGRISIRRYWEPPFHSREEQLDCPFEEMCERTRELLIDAIRIRLRADVPVGCYLSGGLDSSGVTALVKRRFNNNLRTFGIRFEERDFDETHHQDCMVSFLGTDHTEMMARNEEIGSRFPDALWHCEKPILRTAPVPLFLLSKVVHDSGFKVVLTGEGADEVFGGYNIFREAKVRMFWARQPGSTLRPLLIGRLYPYIFHDPRLRATLRSFFAKGLENVDDPFYSHRIRWDATSKIKMFFSGGLREAIGPYDACEELRQNLPESYCAWDPLSRAQYLEMVIFLSNYLLSSQGDRVAMAHSVEIRLPYLDYRIIDLAGRIPAGVKISGLKEKYLLKRVYKGILPEVVIHRSKQPYRAPISQCLYNGMTSYVKELLSDSYVKKAQLFDKSKVKGLLQKIHRTPHASETEGMALAGIVSSHVIQERFIDDFAAHSIKPITPDLLVDRRFVS